MDHRYRKFHYNFNDISAPTIERRNRFGDYLDGDKYPIRQSTLYNNRGNSSCYTCTFPPRYFANSETKVREKFIENFGNYNGRSFYR